MNFQEKKWYIFLAFQYFFSYLPYPGFNISGNLRLNLYTAPAFFALVMNIFGAVVLFTIFDEHCECISISKKESVKCSSDDKMAISVPEKNVRTGTEEHSFNNITVFLEYSWIWSTSRIDLFVLSIQQNVRVLQSGNAAWIICDDGQKI